MRRAAIERDNRVDRDCRSRWPTVDHLPYHTIEKRFTDRKGKIVLV